MFILKLGNPNLALLYSFKLIFINFFSLIFKFFHLLCLKSSQASFITLHMRRHSIDTWSTVKNGWDFALHVGAGIGIARKFLLWTFAPNSHFTKHPALPGVILSIEISFNTLKTFSFVAFVVRANLPARIDAGVAGNGIFVTSLMCEQQQHMRVTFSKKN